MKSHPGQLRSFAAVQANRRARVAAEGGPQLEPAFTVAELLVVVAVLTLLALTLLPALARSQGSAQRTICTDNLRRLMLATTMYATENRDYLPNPNWNSPWVVPGWLYAPTNSSVPDPTAPPYDANPELAYQGGLLWTYTKNMALYRCPLDPTNSAIWNLRQNKLSTYAMNGAVCGYGSISQSGTWRLSQFKPAAFCFLETLTTNPGDFNDGAITPDEGVSRYHSNLTPLGTLGGSVDWMMVNDYYREVALTGPNRAWCNPGSPIGQ